MNSPSRGTSGGCLSLSGVTGWTCFHRPASSSAPRNHPLHISQRAFIQCAPHLPTHLHPQCDRATLLLVCTLHSSAECLNRRRRPILCWRVVRSGPLIQPLTQPSAEGMKPPSTLMPISAPVQQSSPTRMEITHPSSHRSCYRHFHHRNKRPRSLHCLLLECIMTRDLCQAAQTGFQSGVRVCFCCRRVRLQRQLGRKQ